MLLTIRFLVLQTLALHYTGEGKRAQAVAARLFTLTEPENFIRVYLDEGEPMRQFLQTLLDEPPTEEDTPAPISRSYVAHLLAVFEQEEQKPHKPPLTVPTLPQTPAFPQRGGAGSSLPVEPLTRREQEVLRLLAAGASNQEIANALVISLATVKKHVSNLLLKLGAASRTQAIAQAREVSLL